MAHSKTENKQSGTHKRNTKGLIPFVKGDPRINRNGRPSNSAELNNLLDEIFAEQVEDERGRKVEKLRVMLNRMMISKNAASQIHLLDRRFGKIPDVIKGEGKDGEIVIHVGISKDE